MPNPPTRRLLLSTAALGVVSGCIGPSRNSDASEHDDERKSGADQGEDDESDADTEPCDFEQGEWWGESDPIETTVTLKTEPEDDLDEVCANAAADAALDTLNERTAIELEGRNWVQYGWYNDGDDGAYIAVESEQDRNGNVLRCPDPEFDIADARTAIPSEVSVTLHLEETDETHTCTHEIRYFAHQLYLD